MYMFFKFKEKYFKVEEYGVGGYVLCSIYNFVRNCYVDFFVRNK